MLEEFNENYLYLRNPKKEDAVDVLRFVRSDCKNIIRIDFDDSIHSISEREKEVMSHFFMSLRELSFTTKTRIDLYSYTAFIAEIYEEDIRDIVIHEREKELLLALEYKRPKTLSKDKALEELSQLDIVDISKSQDKRRVPLELLVKEASSYSRYLTSEDRFLKNSDLSLSVEFKGQEDWDLEHKRRFIHSILMGLPVGHFYINNSSKEEFHNVLYDGRQRIKTIIDFLQGKFSIIRKNKKYFYKDVENVFIAQLNRPVDVNETSFDNIRDIANVYVLVNKTQLKYDDGNLNEIEKTYYL